MARSPILRVASFVMPRPMNRDLIPHAEIRRNLVATFGGYTSSNVSGAWRDDAGNLMMDYSTRYEVAYDCRTMMDRESNFEKLSLIAVQAGQALGQQAVYLVRHDGIALILEIV